MAVTRRGFIALLTGAAAAPAGLVALAESKPKTLIVADGTISNVKVYTSAAEVEADFGPTITPFEFPSYEKILASLVADFKAVFGHEVDLGSTDYKLCEVMAYSAWTTSQNTKAVFDHIHAQFD